MKRKFTAVALLALLAAAFLPGFRAARADDYQVIDIIGYYAELEMIGCEPGWDNVPSKVTDGNPDTYCQPRYNEKYTIMVDLLGDVLVGKVVIDFYDLNLVSFEVKTSSDKNVWDSLIPDTVITAGVNVYEEERPAGVTFRYLDFSITETAGAEYGCALRAIEIYNHSSFDPMGIPSKPVNTDSDVKYTDGFDLEEYTKTNPNKTAVRPDFSFGKDAGKYSENAGGASYDDPLNTGYLIGFTALGGVFAASAAAAAFILLKKKKNNTGGAK